MGSGGTATLAPGVCHNKDQYTAEAAHRAATTKAHRRAGQGELRFANMPGIIMDAMHTATPFTHLRARIGRGFTLIELMVVLVIIGVLAALIVPNVLDRADDARVTAARADIGNLAQALKLYKLDNQRYPSAAQGLQALVAKPSVDPVPANWKPYLEKLPNDPWGRPYQYMNPGIKAEVDVLSFGADGQAGGEGNNADLGSWQ